jgi:hypothetical protein
MPKIVQRSSMTAVVKNEDIIKYYKVIINFTIERKQKIKEMRDGTHLPQQLITGNLLWYFKTCLFVPLVSIQSL